MASRKKMKDIDDRKGSLGFEAKTKWLATTLRQQQAEAPKPDAAIAANLTEHGYGE